MTMIRFKIVMSLAFSSIFLFILSMPLWINEKYNFEILCFYGIIGWGIIFIRNIIDLFKYKD